MVMSNEEIARSYREAKDKWEQIGILADLNLCSKAEIRKIIQETNTELEPEKKSNRGRKSMNKLVKDLRTEQEKNEAVRDQVMIELKDKTVMLEKKKETGFIEAVAEFVNGPAFKDQIDLLDQEIGKLTKEKEKLTNLRDALLNYIA